MYALINFILSFIRPTHGVTRSLSVHKPRYMRTEAIFVDSCPDSLFFNSDPASIYYHPTEVGPLAHI